MIQTRLSENKYDIWAIDENDTTYVHIEMKVAGHPSISDAETEAVVALVRARLLERRVTNDASLR